MSDRSIELLIRMHSEKTPTMQRGKAVLTGDVITGVLGAMQHTHPEGSDLIMAKWLRDRHATLRAEKRAIEWASSSKSIRPDVMKNVALVALDIFCGRPTSDLNKKLISLWKQQSAQGWKSRRRIKKWQVQIENLSRNLDTLTLAQKSDAAYQIDSLQSNIEREKDRIHMWAKAQAKQTYMCPCCHGSGRTQHGQNCKHCEGNGYFIPAANNVKTHLKRNGIKITDKLWLTDIKPRFDEISSLMQMQHDETAKELSIRLNAEKGSSLSL